ncbi:unnamed protein product [Sphagnum balticum]
MASAYLELDPLNDYLLSLLFVVEAHHRHAHFLTGLGIYEDVDALDSRVLIKDVSQFANGSERWDILNQDTVVDSEAKFASNLLVAQTGLAL